MSKEGRSRVLRNTARILIPSLLWKNRLYIQNLCYSSTRITSDELHEWQKNINLMWDMRWRNLLRPCSTSGKVAGSNPYAVIGIFHSRNSCGRTIFLQSTQTLTKINTSSTSWGVKEAGA